MAGWAIDRLGKMDVAEPVVADLGTGSGAIALAIGQEVPRARVHAVEGDPLARAWAERNVSKYVESDPYTAAGSCCTAATSPTRSANSTVRLTW
jgi:Methylase of polypeptide chain release factors